MKAIPTEACDLELTLPGAGDDRTLPAQRIKAFDPGLGQTEADAHDAILTVWAPDEGERKALVNGARVELVVTGTGHPPVSLNVGNPPAGDLEALLSKAHADRAVGFWFSAIAERLAEDGFPTDAAEVLELWHKALEETREGAAPVDLGERIDAATAAIEEATAAGNGAGEDEAEK